MNKQGGDDRELIVYYNTGILSVIYNYQSIFSNKM